MRKALLAEIAGAPSRLLVISCIFGVELTYTDVDTHYIMMVKTSSYMLQFHCW